MNDKATHTPPQECPPILFITYRKPETTRLVFDAIRKAKPAKLFLSQEAIKPNSPKETADLHKEVRNIISAVDWPCDVHTLFFDKYQGIIDGFRKSFEWFFEHVEYGIMLEDDEIPDQTYFRFCAELLEKYKDDPRVMSISGSNVLEHYDKPYQEYSYYFLSIPTVWGMATWRRAWKHYDSYVRRWPEVRNSGLLYKSLPSKAAAFYFGRKFQGYYDRKINSWDGQWVFTCLANHGLSIYSSKNLISNIGFTSTNAFHQGVSDPLWSDLPTEPISFPLKHPPKIMVNKKWDEYGIRVRYSKVDFNWYQKIKWVIKSSFPSAYIAIKKIYYRIFLPEKYEEYNQKYERLLLQ